MNYKLLKDQARELLKEEPYFVSFFSNLSSIIFNQLEDLNWAGFYLVRNDALVIGPFQGKPACIHIQSNKGVCGTSFYTKKSIIVKDVHKFQGHIACDSASNSELVVPIFKDNKVMALLDLDSPKFARFTEEDKIGFEELFREIEQKIIY